MRHQIARSAGFVLLVAPLLLSACASRGSESAGTSGPSAAQAMTAANESKSTADNALSTAQKALQTAQKAENDAQAASQKSDQCTTAACANRGNARLDAPPRAGMSSRVGVALCAAALAIATTPAAAAQFTLTAGARAVGAVETYVAAASDNLLDLARRYDLGYTQLIAANPGIDPWRPGAGRAIRIP